jgi:hypothetical protein
VIITNVDGHLHVQPWQRPEISIEAAGEVGTLKQEEEALIVANCQCDLVLHIPAMTELASPVVVTDVIVNNLLQGASICRAGNVIVEGVDGDIFLQDIHGDVELVSVNGAARVTSIGGRLHARRVPRLEARYVGGNTILADTARVNLSAVGGDLAVIGADSVTCGAVGSDLEAERVEHKLQCNTVGGHCTVRDCARADVRIHTIGEDFICDAAAPGGPCIVGGNLRLQLDCPARSHLFYHVGGNAHITLPANANLALHTTVGGNARGPLATYVRNGGFITLLYGEGSAQFDLTVDGDLVLSGAEPCHSNCEFSWDEFGQYLAAVY